MMKHMGVLNVRKTIVCEKTDGVRFFLCEILKKLDSGQVQTIWLVIDRKYSVRQVSLKVDLAPHGFETWPRHQRHLWVRNIFDGELVWDNKNTDNAWRQRHPDPLFLVFDALVINGTNLMPLPFNKRLVDADFYLRNRFTKARLLQSMAPLVTGVPQIDIYMKEMFRVQDAFVLFDKILPRLEHENDGLIFTVDAAPYYMGTCPQIWKWKPMHLNTIDFNAKPI